MVRKVSKYFALCRITETTYGKLPFFNSTPMLLFASRLNLSNAHFGAKKDTVQSNSCLSGYVTYVTAKCQCYN